MNDTVVKQQVQTKANTGFGYLETHLSRWLSQQKMRNLTFAFTNRYATFPQVEFIVWYLTGARAVEACPVIIYACNIYLVFFHTWRPMSFTLCLDSLFCSALSTEHPCIKNGKKTHKKTLTLTATKEELYWADVHIHKPEKTSQFRIPMQCQIGNSLSFPKLTCWVSMTYNKRHIYIDCVWTWHFNKSYLLCGFILWIKST